MIRKLIFSIFCLIGVHNVYAMDGERNPASTKFVDQEIAKATSAIFIIMNKEIEAAITASTNSILSTVNQEIQEAVPTVAVGEPYQGGIVVYTDNTKQHGLILALSDVTDSTVIYSTHSEEFGYANGVGAGLLNSASQLGHSDGSNNVNANTRLSQDYASGCAPATGTIQAPGENVCFGQWYVPSLFEWELVLNNFNTIQTALGNDPLNGTYWSSTSAADNAANAYTIVFDDTSPATATVSTGNIETATNFVRGMRQF